MRASSTTTTAMGFEPAPYFLHLLSGIKLTPAQQLLCLDSMRTTLVQCSGILAIAIVATVGSAENPDSSSLKPRTGQAIQSDSPLPMKTRRGRCNPASTRCQLPRHRVQPKDSDLNQRTEVGPRLSHESSLNTRRRTGPSIDSPSTKP